MKNKAHSRRRKPDDKKRESGRTSSLNEREARLQRQLETISKRPIPVVFGGEATLVDGVYTLNCRALHPFGRPTKNQMREVDSGVKSFFKNKASNKIRPAKVIL